MLQLKSISKKFNEEVLRSFSYEFDKNKIYFLSGKNGSGKSTLLKIIKGIYIQDFGEIKIHHEFNKQSDIVYIDGNFRTFFHRLTVYQNLKYFFSLNNKDGNSKILDELLNLFDLSKLQNQKFSTLSQGQMQMISLIRGLSSNPKVLLLDEVFSSFDNAYRKKVFSFLKKFIVNENSLVIFTSHEDNYNNIPYMELCLD